MVLAESVVPAALVAQVVQAVRVLAIFLLVAAPNGSTTPNIAKAFPIVTMPPTKNTTGHRREMFPVTIPSVGATVAPVQVHVTLVAAVEVAATVQAHAMPVGRETRIRVLLAA